MMLACGAVAGTGGGWAMLAIVGVPLLGMLLASGLRRSSTPDAPPERGPARASELPPFPLAATPALVDEAREEDARDDELVGV